MGNLWRRNLGTKIASLLFAALFWLFVMNQKTPDVLLAEQPMTIPLVTVGLPQNMVVMTQLPLVRIRLQGINPSTNIKDIYAQVDLSGGAVGEHSYVIKVNSPVGTHVVDIQPASIKLVLDNVREKTVPVEVVVSGSPAEGYQLGASYVKPSAVNVRGPGSILNELQTVAVDVGVADARETIQISRPVSIRDQEGNPIIGPNSGAEFLSAVPSTVDVIIPIVAQGLSSKTVPIKVTSTGTPAQGKYLQNLIPSQSSVQVLGSVQDLSGFESLDLNPVDVSDLQEDKVFQISLDKIQLPQGLSIYEGTVMSVVAQIGSEIITKEISGLEVQIRNLEADIELEQPIPPLNIVIKGASDILAGVTAEQVQLWIDMAGQGEGLYSDMEVKYQLPDGVEMSGLPPVTYSLRIVEPVEEEE